MICYIDEKMYGPPADGITPEELEEKIKQLEKKIYGDFAPEKENQVSSKKSMIFDVELCKLVERAKK